MLKKWPILKGFFWFLITSKLIIVSQLIKMLKIIKHKIIKNLEIFLLIFLILITAVSTSYFNYKKSNNQKIYNNFVDNIYFKKTLNEIINNLEPKYKKIKHKIK